MDLSANPDSPLSGGGNGSGSSSIGSNSINSSLSVGGSPQSPSRYEAQKRRDWNTFGQYLRNHRPPLSLAQCSGAHVLEFLRYLDQFGKTKVHGAACPFFGHPSPPAPCPCPLRQAWGSLDALVGRLRAAFEEHGGRPEANPFGARAVRLYLREVRDSQAKARGIAYEKKRRKRPPPSSASQKAANKPALSPPQPASMHAAAAPSDRQQPEVIVARAVPAQGHYFIPHPQHFMHGHFLMPGAGHDDAAAASSSSGNSNSNGHSGGAGDEMALAMAAAEAHAAGCMLPLSVFN